MGTQAVAKGGDVKTGNHRSCQGNRRNIHRLGQVRLKQRTADGFLGLQSTHTEQNTQAHAKWRGHRVATSNTQRLSNGVASENVQCEYHKSEAVLIFKILLFDEINNALQSRFLMY